MDIPSGSSNSESQARQKRVLPSRSRRGGPGVGSCDVDMMILETQRRKFDNEPLIPADTPFLLTTNPAVASTSSSSYEINIHANDRYFERPEVLKAYREQSIIQTPEFVSLGDTPAGRLRARSQAGITEDGPSEISDAAYEKRHRKYETFEKRQRLREKEKLKHEQYKLKERIEQLRAMDAAAFMSLPDNLFPVTVDRVDDTVEEGSPGAPVNGSPANSEGERRRQEMLDIAHVLEDRYRVLLPPERTTKKAPGHIAMEASVEPEAPSYVGRDKQISEPGGWPIVETVRQDNERLKLKIKFPTRPTDSTVYVSSPRYPSPKQLHRQSLPPSRVSPRRNKTREGDTSVRATSPISVVDPSSPAPPRLQHPMPIPATPMSNPEIAVLEPGSPEIEAVQEEEYHHISGSTEQHEFASAPGPHKRFKSSPALLHLSSHHVSKESSVPPIESISDPHKRRSPSHASTVQSSKHYVSYTGAAGKTHRTASLLMTLAIRSSGNRATKAKRHLYAFGGKLQNETFEETKDFELPGWVFKSNETSGLDVPELQASVQPGVRTIFAAGEVPRQPP